MNIEIEAKLKVDSLQEIAEKLDGLGAEFEQEQLQTDCHFDDANGTLQKTDCCFRLRRQLVKKDERFFLTYKGAKEKSSFKKRQEIEIEVGDGDSVKELLSALGYENVLTIEKKRLTWHLRDCVVALDRLPLIGSFVEIEGPDEQKIADVQKRLGLAGLAHIKKSYAALIRDKLRELGKEEQRDVFLDT
jgi:adenylate cyclase class 2